jgi:glycogen operon protein
LEIAFRTEGPAQVVELAGDLDGTATLHPADEERLRALLQPGCHLIVDLAKVRRLSPVGLRLVLLFHRRGSALGRVSFTGASQELVDLVEATGFREMARGRFPATPATRARRVRPRIDVYPTHHHGDFALRRGRPFPLGARPVPGGVNFAVYSRHARSCTLVLFDKAADRPSAEVPFPEEFRVGHVFAMLVFGLEPERFQYGYRMDGPWAPEQGHRFDCSKVLLDPFAGCIAGREAWGRPPDADNTCPHRACLVPEDFDWAGDRPPGRPVEDLVIYEMHVRGFTAHPSSGVKFPGTFAGVRERIPYLKELGVNCVELMPVFEFDECEGGRRHPGTGEPLLNYWGYSPVGFYAPKAGYAASGRAGMQVDEFKALVRDLHENGIEVILDVVFNHTAEGDETGPTLSFRGLDNRVYYLLTPDGRYHNFSGCGNTLNCNHPAVRDLVLDCLRHWVAEYHVDGFRFDLASILGRDQDGIPLNNPPLVEALAADPVLGTTKLIAEAWDAAGLYQVGSFPAYGRWAEWNGRFRDCVRKFLKGDPEQAVEMAVRVTGSADLYPTRGPAASVNLVTCHDGFTLGDLVSYNGKHNEANGEGNRDGVDDNHSWNCGAEGPTDDPAVNALRRRQVKNALAMLFLGQGVPMLLMGDECGRTQQGNNNAYCHDGPLTWFDWTLPTRNAELSRFCRCLIGFRKLHPALRHPRYAGRPDDRGERLEVTWHGTRPFGPDWSPESRVLAFELRLEGGAGPGEVIYVAMNMFWEALGFALPAAPPGRRWHVFANTALPPPADVCEPGGEPLLEDQGNVTVGGRSVLVLVAR